MVRDRKLYKRTSGRYITQNGSYAASEDICQPSLSVETEQEQNSYLTLTKTFKRKNKSKVNKERTF